MKPILQRGFTIIETLILLSVVTILVSIAVPSITEGVRHYRADAARETVLMQLRLARSLAAEQRLIYRVRFNPAGSVELFREDPSGSTQVGEVEIPAVVGFRIEPGVVTQGSAAPDGFSADQAIDLNGDNLIWFRPDGSAIGSDGRPCNGVIHMAVAGYPATARAATVFGATGRIRGWTYQPGDGEASGWR